MSPVTPLLVPQVNVNDDTVLLVRWSVAQHASVSAGDIVCEVETSKATSEVTADSSGVLVQTAVPPVRVGVGDAIGAIGPTREAVATYLASKAPAPAAADGTLKATPRAAARAAQAGVTLEAVAQSGVRGTIKESDVERFLAALGDVRSAGDRHDDFAALEKYLERTGPVSPFDAAVAANLRRSVAQLILTSVDADCRLTAARAVIDRALAGGRMLSPLHFIVAAAGRALPRFPRLMSIVHDGSIYRHRAVDVAFVVRTPDGKLFTPVVRAADRATVDDIATACQASTLKILRGGIRAEELDGACFTISHVPIPGTTRVVALPNIGQSAILGVSAERMSIALVDGAPVAQPVVTLTLTYDHALCDGYYAAGFLADMVREIEQPAS
jgi:pyruvate dehydrogenase E2 component (dihydrolipoamide acetyltransferase)